ncbi:MAG: hypothetical protein ACK48C_13625, partial [Roseiflexaceae bacterium]
MTSTSTPTPTTGTLRSEAECEALFAAGEMDLSYCQLRNLTMGDANQGSLLQRNFSYSILENVKFISVDMYNSNFMYAQLNNVEFNIFYLMEDINFANSTCKCTFSTTGHYAITVANVTFTNADLRYSKFMGKYDTFSVPGCSHRRSCFD